MTIPYQYPGGCKPGTRYRVKYCSTCQDGCQYQVCNLPEGTPLYCIRSAPCGGVFVEYTNLNTKNEYVLIHSHLRRYRFSEQWLEKVL